VHGTDGVRLGPPLSAQQYEVAVGRLPLGRLGAVLDAEHGAASECHDRDDSTCGRRIAMRRNESDASVRPAPLNFVETRHRRYVRVDRRQRIADGAAELLNDGRSGIKRDPRPEPGLVHLPFDFGKLLPARRCGASQKSARARVDKTFQTGPSMIDERTDGRRPVDEFDARSRVLVHAHRMPDLARARRVPIGSYVLLCGRSRDPCGVAHARSD
jgi:hypothetical protein